MHSGMLPWCQGARSTVAAPVPSLCADIRRRVVLSVHNGLRVQSAGNMPVQLAVSLRI